MIESRLTTKDNPYDPFSEFYDWLIFDEVYGYHTCGLIDRVAETFTEIKDQDGKIKSDAAIELILMIEPETYKVVRKNID